MTTDRYLEISPYKISLVAVDHGRLPPYKGSTLRGAMGWALKDLTCVEGLTSCAPCERSACAYREMFEPRPAADLEVMAKTVSVPRPFVIEPPASVRREYSPGDRLVFGVVLFGRAARYLPHVIASFQQAGQRGLGRAEKVRFVVESVLVDDELRETSDVLPMWKEQLPVHVGFRFETPLRLEKDPAAAKRHPEFGELFGRIVRRAQLVDYFYGTGTVPGLQGRLKDLAAKVERVGAELTWLEWERHSSRSGKYPTGGLVGDVVYQGEFAELMPLLLLGQYLHLGKDTSMGMGRYRLFAPSIALSGAGHDG